MRTRATLIGLALVFTLSLMVFGGELQPLSHILYGPSEDVATYDSYIVAASGSYLVFLNEDMDVITDLDLGSKIKRMAVDGHWCYAAVENGKLKAVNLTTLPNPYVSSSVFAAEDVQDMKIGSGMLYLAAEEGIYPVDITGTPILTVGEAVGLEGESYKSVESYGSFIIAGRRRSDCDIFSLDGEHISTIETSGRPVDMETDGSKLYVLDNWSRLDRFDISDPYSPELESEIMIASPANRLHIDGEELYISTATGRVTAFDISREDTAPREMGHYSGSEIFYGMSFKEGFLYTAAFFGGVYKLDARSPYDINDEAVFDQAGYALQTVINGDYAYIAHGPGGFVIVDITDRSNPEIVSRIKHGYVSDLKLFDDYLYVLDETGSIFVYNISGGMPSITIELPLSSSRLCGLEVQHGLDGHDYLYTMEFNRRVITMNIDDPALPRFIWDTDIHYTPGFDLDQVWNFLAVTTSDGFQLYDNLFFPDEPRWYNHFTVDGMINDIAAVESTCVIATDDNGAFLLTLGHRVPLASTPIPIDDFTQVKGVGAWDHFAVLAASNNGIAIYDMEYLNIPLRIDNVEMAGTYEVDLDEESGLMAASRGYNGVNFIDASTIFKTCIHFQRGWNTVSLPIDPDDATLGSGIPSTTVGAFTYDPVSRTYSGPITEMEPGNGYFFFSERDTVVFLEGAEIDPVTVDLVPGWNLIGTGSKRVSASSLVGRSSVLAQFYQYDADECAYIHEEHALEPNQAYWVLALDYLTLNLTNGSISLGKVSTSTPYSRSDFPPYPPSVPGDNNDNDINEETASIIEISGNPNPFNAATAVRINLPNDSNVKASVYDLSGRIVETIIDNHIAAGVHTITWTPDNSSASGVYMFRVETDYGAATQKLLLAR